MPYLLSEVFIAWKTFSTPGKFHWYAKYASNMVVGRVGKVLPGINVLTYTSSLEQHLPGNAVLLQSNLAIHDSSFLSSSLPMWQPQEKILFFFSHPCKIGVSFFSFLLVSRNYIQKYTRFSTKCQRTLFNRRSEKCSPIVC
jgi:hypothetical protein